MPKCDFSYCIFVYVLEFMNAKYPYFSVQKFENWGQSILKGIQAFHTVCIRPSDQVIVCI